VIAIEETSTAKTPTIEHIAMIAFFSFLLFANLFSKGHW
jgi:hypothetical protein